ANIQAIWIYRNYFKQEFDAAHHEIAIIASADTHYSVVKASNLLHIDQLSVNVDEDSRAIDQDHLDQVLTAAKAAGKKYFIVLSNVATTMFGSVDNPDIYVQYMQKHNLEFKLHLD